ncbi:MAG TPA: phosphatase PAP2 family protein [Hanamia sp.]|nr:phosphatase PAP2 family protein [Hanamia sp.]
MIRKKFFLSLLTVSFIFYSCALYGQDTNKVNSISDSSFNAENYQHHYLKPTALIAPAAFLLYGGLKPFINGIPKLDNDINNNIHQNYPDFHTSAANYLMWAPSASLYVLDAFKVKTEHNFREHLILDAGSILLTGGIGYGMRIISRNIKTYNSSDTKFPSGHTANAFRGAEILHQELKRTNKLLSYSGYLIATGVGLLRIYDKDHLLSEVITGAGLGIISTKLTYWIFDKVKYRNKKKRN